jgi:multidrug efflux pump
MSLVISLTLTPMMCAKFMRPNPEQGRGRLFRASEWFFDQILKVYRHSLGWVLRHQAITLLITILTAGLSIYLYVKIPKGFFPQQDTGRLGGSVQGEQDIAFPAMRDKMLRLTDIVLADPAIDTVGSFAGGGGPGGGGSNTGRMFIMLKPLNERKITADQVISRLRPKLTSVPGATLFLQSQQELQIGGRQSNSQYQYTLQSEDLNELNTWAPRILAKLRTLPDLRDVNSDQQDKGLSAQVIIDRDSASRLGISAAQIDSLLYHGFGQAQVSVMYKPLNQYHVVMEAAPQFQQGADALQNVYVHSSNGTEVPLSAFARFAPSNTSLQVNHQGMWPAVTISFNLPAQGVSLDKATRAIETAMVDIGVPSDVHGSFQGTAAAFKDTAKSQPLLILAALVTVYIVLGMLYESTIHPITILSTLPSAGVGALLALMLTHTDLTVIAVIGIILLIGIVKKNAILMIDFAIQAERQGTMAPVDAIYQACLLRFRPIMMTTMAALLGGLPLALGAGTGAELRRPLGIAIVGGLIVSQALTLYTTPVVYLYLDRFRLRVGRWKASLKRGRPVESSGD